MRVLLLVGLLSAAGPAFAQSEATPYVPQPNRAEVTQAANYLAYVEGQRAVSQLDNARRVVVEGIKRQAGREKRPLTENEKAIVENANQAVRIEREAAPEHPTRLAY